MAKKETTFSDEMNNILSVEKINNALNAEAIGAHVDLPISTADAFKFFQDADDSAFETLGGATYLNWDEFKPGKYVFIFTGVTSWKGVDQRTQQEKVVPAVKLLNEAGEEFICAGKLIVDNCSAIRQIPCMIRVVYGGKQRAANGNTYFDLKVQVGKEVL